MRLRKPDLVFREGKLVSVIVPIKTYQRLLEIIEDAEDVRWLAKTSGQKKHFRPLEEYLEDYKKSVNRKS